MIADIVIAGVLLVSGILAYFRGLIRETLTVAGWIGAAFATLYGFPHLRPVIGEFITSGLLTDLASAALIFIVTLVLLTVLTHIISERVKVSSLGHLDCALGFVFGVLRGAVLVALVYIGATIFWTERDFPPAIAEAKSLPLVRAGAELLVRLAPEDSLPGHGRPYGGVDSAIEGVEGAAKQQLEEMIEEIEAKDRLRRLNEPRPETAPPPGEAPPDEQQQEGYTDAERRDMQRLIEGAQDKPSQ